MEYKGEMESHEVKTEFNLDMIKSNIQLIQQDINNMELQGISDPFDFELAIMEKYPEFYSSNPYLVKKICKRDNLDMLYQMFDNLEQIEKGDKSMASVELNLGQQLAKQFLYPKIEKKD